jgi:hypothetical protein
MQRELAGSLPSHVQALLRALLEQQAAQDHR